jgi:PAS domain S-box-containing protein
MPHVQFSSSPRTSLDNIMVGTWDLDFSTGEVVWNKAHELLMGYDPGSPIRSAHDFDARVHPEDLENVKKAMADAVVERKDFQFEFKVVWQDGSVHWLQSRGRPTYDKAGRPQRMSGTLIDISEKKRLDQANKLAEKFIHDWEDRYRSLISVMASIVWTTDPVGQMVATQESWEQYTGQSYSEYSHFGWLSSIHDDDRDHFMQEWARARDQQKVFQCEGRVWSQKDQSYRYFFARAVPLFNENKSIKEWVGKFSDIHDRKMAERALKESEERFRVALKNAPMLAASADVDLRYTWIQNGHVLFGKHNIIGKSDFDLLDFKTSKKLMELKRKVLLSKKGLRENVTVTKPDGKQIFDVTVEPLLCENGFPTGITMACLDITGAKKNEEAALAASSAKTQFLANMSHEIRTPIGVILGYSELAAQTLESNPQALAFIQSIHRNAEHLLSLIGEILDLSKIEADKIELEPVAVNVAQLANEVVQGFVGPAKEKGLSLEMDLKSVAHPVIITDPTRLRQILNNIIGNAVKFTHRGSVVLKIKNDEENVSFKVKDTGIGLRAEQVEKLFMPFSQGDNSMSRRFGGTGLGLMVSKGLAKRMGGDLKLRSTKVGVGSEFELKIPAKLSSISLAPVNKNTISETYPELQKARILLIEDSKDNQVIVTTYLKDVGCHIDVADDGLEGLQKATGAHYDIILLDIQMPIIDGYETLRLLTEHNVAAPIVALTAHAMKTERDKAIAAGFKDYITKPVNRKGLIAKLNEILILSTSEKAISI